MADDDRTVEDGSPEPALRVAAPEDTAAGLPAVASAMRRSLGGMGVRRSASTFLRINQPDGFDCPGCAWPEAPPGERSHLELCENGPRRWPRRPPPAGSDRSSSPRMPWPSWPSTTTTGSGGKAG